MIEATRCSDCGSFVPRNIYFDRMGKNENAPLWVCPICGVVHEDHRWYRYVGQEEATEILEHRGRCGLFVQEDGGTYIGIDNSTGDAWTEDFPDPLECLMWLAEKREGGENK